MRSNLHNQDAHTHVLGNTLFLFLPFLCSEMMAVPGLHSLYVNRVNTFWHLYPVYNQTFLSSPLMLLCGFCWAAFKWWKQEESWGVGWMGVEVGVVCFFGWCLSWGNLSESYSLQVHVARFQVINSPSHHKEWERCDQWVQWSEWPVAWVGLSMPGGHGMRS